MEIKELDPDPHEKKCGSTTLLKIQAITVNDNCLLRTLQED
jgi:hypothetical protein